MTMVGKKKKKILKNFFLFIYLFSGSTLLHTAAIKNHHEIVSYLINYGCLLEKVRENSWKKKLIFFFFQKKDAQGRTPLHVSVVEGAIQ